MMSTIFETPHTTQMTIDINEMLHRRVIRGIPTQEGIHTNDDGKNELAFYPTEYSSLYNCPSSKQVNVNTFLGMSLVSKTNYGQLYMNSSLLAHIPYILLENIPIQQRM